jgi:hypothetical protein
VRATPLRNDRPEEPVEVVSARFPDAARVSEALIMSGHLPQI